MRIYLDDDLDSNLLISFPRRVRHEVVSPREVGTRGVVDAAHLSYAAAHALVLLTANAADFIELHEEWLMQGREHQGILIVYRENNPTRDMSSQQIAQAVTRLEQSGLPLKNLYHNLNFWRE